MKFFVGSFGEVSQNPHWKPFRRLFGAIAVQFFPIFYPRFGVLINTVSKEGIAYRVTIDDILCYTCLDFTKISSQSLGKKGKWVYCKHCYYVFRFLCKVDYDSDKFIHASTCSYNEVMRLLELVGVVKCE